jgi:hypothetical protein
LEDDNELGEADNEEPMKLEEHLEDRQEDAKYVEKDDTFVVTTITGCIAIDYYFYVNSLTTDN